MDYKFLPIGTVVQLNGGTKKIMIIGFMGIDENDITYDYIGCLYPEGYLGDSNMLLFNKNQIDKIFYQGFINEEEMEFKNSLKANDNNSEDIIDIIDDSIDNGIQF